MATATATMTTNKYTFEETAPTYEFKTSNPYSRGGRARKNSYGDSDDNGSLTYSAASSMGESTDSSFAEIRKALEEQGDSKELAAFLKRRGVRDEKSVAADSLAYSTDAESHLRFGGESSLAYSADSYARSLATDLQSHLQGSDLVSGSGQNSSHHHQQQHSSELSASYMNNGGGQRFDEDPFLMFAPAEHTEGMKRRKERKRRERREKRKGLFNVTVTRNSTKPANDDAGVNTSTASSTATPKASGGSVTTQQHDFSHNSSYNSSYINNSNNSSPSPNRRVNSAGSPRGITRPSSPARSSTSRESRQGTPPNARPPMSASNTPNDQKRGMEDTEALEDDDADVWYAKWWMFCFPDLIRSLK